MHSIFLSYLAVSRPLGYLLAFIGMAVEGDTVLFVMAFSTQQGLFDPVLMFLSVLFGVLMGDTLWYKLGQFIGEPRFFFSRWIENLAKPFDAHIMDRPIKTIFLSKFTYGFNHAIIMRAGMMGVRFRDLIKGDFMAAVPWILIVGGLGYLSGASFVLVKHYLRIAEWGLLLGLALFLFIWHFIKKYSKKRL